VQVDTWADLRIQMTAAALRPASSGMRLTILGGIFGALALLVWVAGSLRRTAEASES
jgi:hypothetical protein